MQKFKNATIGKRLLAYIIDYFILGIIANLIFKIVNNSYADVIKEVTLIQTEAAQSSTAIDLADLINQYQNIPNYGSFVSAVNYSLLALLAIALLYFILLPILWNKQTLGRAAMNIKLVTKFDEEAKLPSLLMRQVLGRFATFLSFILFGVGAIVQLILVLNTKPTTIEDSVAGTKMVDLSKLIDSKYDDEPYDLNNNSTNVYAPKEESSESLNSDDDVFDFIEK